MDIKNVVAITPVWGEPLGMIQKFLNAIGKVCEQLTEKGIGFRHFFLNDGAIHLPEDFPILVRHKENLHLARTLVDGYCAVLKNLKSKPDLVIRLDCQEHDPLKIPFIVDHFSHSSQLQALFLPVWYWIEGQDRPLMKDITAMIAEFFSALSPVNKKLILEVYNQKFPLGYQVFRAGLLERILPLLEKSLQIFEEKFEVPASWGLDLLTILLAANKYPDAMDFVFGGWSYPWQENRSPEKTEAQRYKAGCMVDVAIALDCNLK